MLGLNYNAKSREPLPKGRLSTDDLFVLTSLDQPLSTLFTFFTKQATLKRRSTVLSIEMKGITRCKLKIISESAVCKKFLVQIVSYPASL